MESVNILDTQQVSSGDAGSSNKSGPLEKLSIRVLSKNKKWSSYTFKIMNETHLKYFKSGVRAF